MKATIDWNTILELDTTKKITNELLNSLPKDFNLATLRNGLETSKSRVIKDAIWGIIPLTKYEGALLDSYILQRLRYIKQLGLAYLVYPTATYSRFDHSIGVVHVIDHISASIRYNAESNNYLDEIKPQLNTIPLIRIAALLHDIGHGPFSHISERFTQDNNEEISNLLLRFKYMYQKSINLSEFISALLCLMEPLKTFIDDDLSRNSDLLGNTFDCLNSEAVASIILGVAPGDIKNLFAAQLISSIYDADKLDYMLRESHFTRLSLPFDEERIISKYQIRKVRLKDVHHNEFREIKDNNPDKEIFVLATDVAGSANIVDIYLSRCWLYDKIYYHHKIRAAEENFQDVLKDHMDTTKISYIDLMRKTDDQIFSMIDSVQLSSNGQTKLSKIRNRNISHRILSFADRLLIRDESIVDIDGGDQEEAIDFLNFLWTSLFRSLEKKESVKKLLDEIYEEYKVICNLLNSSIIISRRDLYLAKPNSTPIPSKALVFVFDDNRIIPFENAELKAPEQWSQAYSRIRETGYIFGPREEIIKLSIACESIFYRNYKVRFKIDAYRMNDDQIELYKETKYKLDAKDYYRKLSGVRPVPKILKTGQGLKLIESFERKFASFDRGIKGSTWLPKKNLELFISQFPSGLEEEMISLLVKEGSYFTKNEIVELITDTISSIDTNKANYLCPIGTHKDSAGHISREFPEELINKIKEFYQIQYLDSGSSIIFFDDIISTGGQLIDIISNWINEPQESKLGEYRDQKIKKEILQDLNVSFIFAFGNKMACQKVEEYWHQKIGNECQVLFKEDLKKYRGKIKGVSNNLKLFLSDVGKSILETTKMKSDPEKWTEDKVSQCSLGYGNEEALLIFPYNAPTITLTALWNDGGQYNNQDWIPLFPRMTKV